MIGELNEFQIKSVLSGQALGRLACSDNDHPYIVPITYAYDGTYIYGQTNEGKKLEILRKNPMICFEVDLMFDMRNWQSVIVMGTFEELTGDDSESARTILYNRVFSLKTSSTIHPFGHEVTTGLDDTNRVKMVMFRILPISLTGRFEKQ